MKSIRSIPVWLGLVLLATGCQSNQTARQVLARTGDLAARMGDAHTADLRAMHEYHAASEARLRLLTTVLDQKRDELVTLVVQALDMEREARIQAVLSEFDRETWHLLARDFWVGFQGAQSLAGIADDQHKREEVDARAAAVGQYPADRRARADLQLAQRLLLQREAIRLSAAETAFARLVDRIAVKRAEFEVQVRKDITYNRTGLLAARQTLFPVPVQTSADVDRAIDARIAAIQTAQNAIKDALAAVDASLDTSALFATALEGLQSELLKNGLFTSLLSLATGLNLPTPATQAGGPATFGDALADAVQTLGNTSQAAAARVPGLISDIRAVALGPVTPEAARPVTSTPNPAQPDASSRPQTP